MCKFVFLLATCLINTALTQQQRIAGGVKSRLGQDPYAAAILFAEDNVYFRVICGGAIINNRSVLSATSCFTTVNSLARQLRIRVGSIYPNSGGSLHNVTNIIFHPNYDSWNRNNNICLLRVNSIFPLGNNVRPIALPAANLNLPSNASVLTMGWGQTSVNGPLYSKLHRVEIKTVGHVNCQNIYGPNFVTANHFCAGWSQTPARGACAGDEGAPLLLGNVIVGVTSFVIGCGDTHFPTIYSYVVRYINWIRTNA